MNTLKNFLTGGEKNEEPEDLNKPEDIRRVIEKVEVIDSIDVDAIHTQLSDIAREKAASRQEQGHGSNLRKTPEPTPDKAQKKLPGFEDYHEQEANVSMPNKQAVETRDSNPYLKNDNVTAFID